MSFRWDQPTLVEEDLGERPSVWIYLLIFVVVECVALGWTVATWPKGQSVNSWAFVRGVLLFGPLAWLALCAYFYQMLHGQWAFETAVVNREAWRLKKSWRRASRNGIGVLDSVVLAPEPDLAERMLSLDGEPPENPGKVMALELPHDEGAETRLHGVLTQLLVPLAPKLARAIKSESFLLVMQGDRDDSSQVVYAVWKKLQLLGVPRIVRMRPNTDPKFAEKWFDADSDPYYRLVLAWHLNDSPDEPSDCSEFAVALLLGSQNLLYNERGKLRAQAWLLRGIGTEADQVEDALTLLLGAEQIETKRIRQFWHSRLKGLAQHATVGAVRESGLEVATHVVDSAIGPQAPASRWLVYSLAAKMAHFGQGAQLVALPGEKGVTLNLAVKELQGVNMPWKNIYDYSIVPVAEWAFVSFMLLIMFLLDPDKGWNGLDTAIVVIWVVALAAFLAARIHREKRLIHECWRRTRGGSW
jgi:hypothetical protein